MKILRYTFPLLLAGTLLFTGCKKEDLVDTASNEIQDITTQEQLDDNIKDGVSMIFFHASWCIHCKEQRPAVEAVSENSEFLDVFFGEIEYDEHKDIVKSKNINGFPTIVIYNNGEEHMRFDGKDHSKDDLEKGLRSALD